MAIKILEFPQRIHWYIALSTALRLSSTLVILFTPFDHLCHKNPNFDSLVFCADYRVKIALQSPFTLSISKS